MPGIPTTIVATVGNVYNPYGTVSLGEGLGFVRNKKSYLIWKGNEALIFIIVKQNLVDILYCAHFSFKNWLSVKFS